jgi:hypothetical protein
MSLFDKEKNGKDSKKEETTGKEVVAQELSLDAMAGEIGVDLPDDFVGTLEPVILKAPILHSAGLFEFPDGTKEDFIEGIVVLYTTPNAWWRDEKSNMPACFSFDGITPDGSEPVAEECLTCEKNQFGSDGAGKACSNKIRLFMLVDGKKIPYMVSLAAKSIKGWREYITHLNENSIRFFATITRIKLDVIDDGKWKYSIAKPENKSIFDYYDNDMPTVNSKIRQVLELIKMNAKKMRTEEITKDESTVEASGSGEGLPGDPY